MFTSELNRCAAYSERASRQLFLWQRLTGRFGDPEGGVCCPPAHTVVCVFAGVLAEAYRLKG